MNPLWIGLKNTFTQIRKRKVYFTFLVILQILLLVSITGTILFFGVKMIGNVNDITLSLDKNIGSMDGKVTQDQALEQAYGLLTTYNLLKQNFFYMMIWLIIILLTVQFKMWMFSLFFFNTDYKSWRESWKKLFSLFFQQWLKYIFSSVMIITPLFLIVYFALNKAINMNVSPDSFTLLLRVLFYVSVPLYFVLITAFASMSALSWRDYFKQIFFLLTRKIHYCSVLFILECLLLSVFLTPVYFTMANENFFNLSLVMIFIFNIVLVISRLWWISSLKELCKERRDKK